MILPTSAGTAVSTRNARAPRCIAEKPMLQKSDTSKSVNPPSGPIARVTGSFTFAGQGVGEAGCPLQMA